jgi:hypothetical protein
MSVVKITWHPSPNQLRLFALVQVLFFALISMIIVRHSGNWQSAEIVMACSVAMAIVGICSPRIIRLVYVAWMAVLFPITLTVSFVLMALIFYWLFAPIGLIMKLVGRDPMRRKLDVSADTYWIRREQKREEAAYFKQY